VKVWTDPASPWGKRLHFDVDDFENMMDDLRARAGDGSFTEGAGVDVDLVLLRGLGLEADFATLPNGILGRTIFAADGSALIEVSRELSEAAETDVLARRRLRTTLAHEAGHASCHPQLFFQDTSTLSLFGDAFAPQERPGILCRDDAVGRLGYNGEWWEYQANQCMASLLLPRRLFRSYVEKVLRALQVRDFERAIREGLAEQAVRQLAGRFDVSQQVVFYRLSALGFVPKADQSRLVFVD
jgi:hypothetical protein